MWAVEVPAAAGGYALGQHQEALHCGTSGWLSTGGGSRDHILGQQQWLGIGAAAWGCKLGATDKVNEDLIVEGLGTWLSVCCFITYSLVWTFLYPR